MMRPMMTIVIDDVVIIIFLFEHKKLCQENKFYKFIPRKFIFPRRKLKFHNKNYIFCYFRCGRTKSDHRGGQKVTPGGGLRAPEMTFPEGGLPGGRNFSKSRGPSMVIGPCRILGDNEFRNCAENIFIRRPPRARNRGPPGRVFPETPGGRPGDPPPDTKLITI